MGFVYIVILILCGLSDLSIVWGLAMIAAMMTIRKITGPHYSTKYDVYIGTTD